MISFRLMLDLGVAQLYRSSSTKRQFCDLLNNFTANSVVNSMQPSLKPSNGTMAGPEKGKLRSNSDERWQFGSKWPTS